MLKFLGLECSISLLVTPPQEFWTLSIRNLKREEFFSYAYSHPYPLSTKKENFPENSLFYYNYTNILKVTLMYTDSGTVRIKTRLSLCD